MDAMRNGRHGRYPESTGPRVRTANGRHYISSEDFLTFPTTVRETILPKFKVLHVARRGQVVMVASLPQPEDMFEVEEF